MQVQAPFDRATQCCGVLAQPNPLQYRLEVPDIDPGLESAGVKVSSLCCATLDAGAVAWEAISSVVEEAS